MSATPPRESTAVGTASSRIWRGFYWGVLATVAMSIPMMIGVGTGVSPLPQPIPVAIVITVFGAGLPQPLLVTLAAGSHLAYGGFWGGLLNWGRREVGIGTGIAVGALLWFFMQVAVLPFIGWGAFGVDITPAIALVTLVLHLIYGATLGWGLSRSNPQDRSRE